MSTRAPISPAATASPCAARRRSRIGMTRSLETVIASATLSTTTIPVAADRPPSMVVSARTCAPALSGSASTVRSRSIAPSEKVSRPAIASGATNRLMSDEIGREQPGGAGDVGATAALDHADVELARQQQDRQRRQQRRRQPVGGIGRRAHHRGDARRGRAGAEQLAEAAEQPPDDEGADGEEGDELDHRLDRDRQDQPVLVLGRVDPPRAERHGEGGEQEGDGEIEQRPTARPASAVRARTNRPPSASSG